MLAGSGTFVSFPEARLFEDFEHWLQNWTANEVETDFLEMVQDVSLTSAAAVLESSEGNISFSPLAYYFQLASLWEASAGETKNQIGTLLKTKIIDRVREQSGNLYRLVYSDNEVGRQKIANSFWLNESSDVRFHADYRESMARDFYTETGITRFGQDLSNSVMNEWIVAHTDHQHESASREHTDDSLTFISTFQFHDQWIERFDPEATTSSAFYLADGQWVQTSYLQKRAFTPMHDSPAGFMRAELLLKNGNHMVIVLPDDGVDLDHLVSDRQSLLRTLEEGETTYAEIAWQIPTFSIETNLDLKTATSQLAFEALFTEKADFSPLLSESRPLGDMRQLSSIYLSEEGVSTRNFLPIPT